MDFKDLTLDNIDSISDDDLLEMMYQSFIEVKPVHFIKEEKHDLSKKIATPKFNYIKKEIKYRNEEEFFFIQVPIIDEQERSHFKVNVFSKEGFYDRMPKDGFMKMTSRVELKAFGVIDLYFEGSIVTRKPNEFKHLNYNRGYEHIESFYYDFEENQYLGVDDEQMKNARRALLKNPDFDFLESPERVQEYFRRERITEVIKNRLKESKELCEDKFCEIKDARYNISIVGGKPIAQENIYAAMNYLANYYSFLVQVMPKWLKIKLIFSDINLTEYEKLVQEVNNLENLIEEGKDMLYRMSSLIYDRTKQQPLLFNWDNLDSGTEEGKLKQEFVKRNGPKDQLERFLTPRPSEFNKHDPLLGFIDYDLERKEVYPNVAESERRNYRTEEHSSYTVEENYCLTILEHFGLKRQD